VISRSPSQVQPVLDIIAQTAGRLCQAENTAIWRIAGDVFQLAAHTTNDATLAKYLAENTLPAGPTSLVGRVALAQRTIQIADVLADPVLSTRPHWLRGEARTALGVPLLHDGVPTGVITLARPTVQPFTDKQIELVATFADQAVIAIENTRLFQEVQTRTRELSESLEYQTATSEVLDVISRSPAEVQPVLDSIVKIAAQLCKADHAHVFRFRDGKYHLAAHNQKDAHIVEYLSNNPIGLDQLGSVTARAARVLKTVHVPDVVQDPEYGHGPLTFSNDRTVLSVPLLRDGAALGVVTVGRHMPRPFTHKEIVLIETFADQAVIAIENTRLFEEVQARTHELTVSLEQQTATGEVLRAISRSPTDLQPIFEAIVRCASQLCGGEYSVVTRYDGQLIHLAAQHNPRPGTAEETAKLFPHPPTSDPWIPIGRALVDKVIVHVPDMEVEEMPPWAREVCHRLRLRAVVAVPMLHEGSPVGVVAVSRERPGPFSDRQVDLL